eukprot:gene12110-biopygen9430
MMAAAMDKHAAAAAINKHAAGAAAAAAAAAARDPPQTPRILRTVSSRAREPVETGQRGPENRIRREQKTRPGGSQPDVRCSTGSGSQLESGRRDPGNRIRQRTVGGRRKRGPLLPFFGGRVRGVTRRPRGARDLRPLRGHHPVRPAAPLQQAVTKRAAVFFCDGLLYLEGASGLRPGRVRGITRRPRGGARGPRALPAAMATMGAAAGSGSGDGSGGDGDGDDSRSQLRWGKP